ncbi:hypothetical protein AGMMS50239_23850 [Bacteroidia bacterium]|nr:hypothetical protein AGMMS50239_23850 [Bacteroidia bacterium]
MLLHFLTIRDATFEHFFHYLLLSLLKYDIKKQIICMKVKKIIVAITVLMTVVLGFTACINGGTGNRFNYPFVSPAIIDYDLEAGILLKTAYGNFVPDNASAASFMTLIGSCIFTSFDYNSEYQTGKYNVASNIIFEQVGIDDVSGEDAEMINDYTYPFSSVELSNDWSISLNYASKFFIATKAKLAQNQALNYYLYTKYDEQPDATGAKNIYLQAKLPGTGGSQDVATVRALEMRSMLYSFGRDTTINEGGMNYPLRYLKLNLKYCSGTENGAPVFKSATTQPFTIYVLRDDL